MKNDYKYKNLNKKIFRNINLKESSFQRTSISKANFINCNIDKCDFWESNLSSTKFSNSKFKNCVFSDADLSKASFVNSAIIQSNLSHANLKNVDFATSKLIKVNLRDAIFNNKTKWPEHFNPLSFGAIQDVKIKKKIIRKKNYLTKIEKKIVYALTLGKGYYDIKNYFSEKKIKKALNLILKEIYKDNNIKKNYRNFSRDKKNNQFYVYKNLINRDKVFIEFIQPKIAMNVFKKLLGEKFICGFFGANCLLPGARGQPPHLDYPYLDMVNPGERLPFDIGKKFLFNCQILIPLNDFNFDNGSPAWLPGSHKFCKFPKEQELKKRKFKQIKIKAGSLMLSNGLIWHASMPNYTYDQNRICLLGQYLPYFIKPMLDLQKTTSKKIITKDKSYLRQLLGVNLTYPRKSLTAIKYK